MSFYKMGRTVGEFTRRYRENKSLTQDDLAHKLGVHPQYISNIERGVHRGAIEFVNRFSPLLDRDSARHLYNLAVDERMENIIEHSGVRKNKATPSGIKRQKRVSQSM